MGQDKLTDYCIDKLSRGYKTDDLNAYLLKAGYSPQDAKSAISQALAYINNPSIRLLGYVQQLRKQGYSDQQIRNSLLAKGYSHEALDSAFQQHVVHKVEISSVMIIVIIAILGIIGVAYYFFSSGSAILDYSIDAVDKKVAEGSSLRYTDRFVNMGSKKDYDVEVTYTIHEMMSNEVVDSWQETIMIDSLENHQGTQDIQDIPPGRYLLRGIVRYYGKEARGTDTFEVTAQAQSCTDGIKNQDEEGIDCGGACRTCPAIGSCSDDIKNQDEEGIDCGGICTPCPAIDSCSDGIRNQDEEGIDCGGMCTPCKIIESCDDGIQNQHEAGIDCGDICKPCAEQTISESDLMAKVKALSPGQEADGLLLCGKAITAKVADDCHLVLSSATNSSEICSKIQLSIRKDTCYMYFVNNGDYSVCEMLDDPWLKRACKSLKQMKILEETE